MTNRWILLSLTLALPAANAQQTPTVDSILASYAKAIGDKSAWDRVQSQRITADYEEPGGATGKVVILLKRPNLILRTLTLTDEGAIFKSAIDRETAWAITPAGEVQTPPPPVAQSFVREARFDRHWRWNEIHPNLSLVGSLRFSGRDHHTLESKSADGVTERFYFAKDTGLLHRRETVLGPGDANRIEYYFDEYAEFEGLKMPSVIRRTTQSPNTLRVAKVENNIAIPDSVFRMPAASK